MTTNILTILLIVALAVSVCYLILGIYSWVESRMRGKEAEKFELGSGGSMERFYEDLEPSIKELAFFETLSQTMAVEAFKDLGKDSRFIIENIIKTAIKKGVEYKSKYKALSKDKQLELRKFCVGQYFNPNTSSSDRIKHADILYQYIATGKQPENKEEQP